MAVLGNQPVANGAEPRKRRHDHYCRDRGEQPVSLQFEKLRECLMPAKCLAIVDHIDPSFGMIFRDAVFGHVDELPRVSLDGGLRALHNKVGRGGAKPAVTIKDQHSHNSNLLRIRLALR